MLTILKGHRPLSKFCSPLVITLLLTLISLLTTINAVDNTPASARFQLKENYQQKIQPGVSKLQSNSYFKSVRGKRNSRQVDNCISNIQRGQISIAVRDFHYLYNDTVVNNNALVNKIIKNSYSNNINNFYNVLQFSQSIGYLNRKLSEEAYFTLYKEMEENYHRNDPKIVSLIYRIHELIENTHDMEMSSKLQNILFNNEPLVRSFISKYASEIQNGFNSNLIILDNDDLIKTLIKEVYNNDINNYYNLIKFLQSLTYFYQISIAYPALFEELESNNKLNDTKILLLDFGVTEAIKEHVDPEDIIKTGFKSKLEDLKMKLDPYIKTIKSLTATHIKNGQFHNIIELIRHNYKAFEYYIPELIKIVYDKKKENFQSILNFVRAIPWIESASVVLSALYDEVTENFDVNDEIKSNLLSEARLWLRMSNYRRIPENYKNLLNNLERNLRLYY